MSWLFVVGIVIFLVGLMVSIGLHEIGHLVPAKLFGVKVTQYMVGFGPTMWSRRKGETEYGVKWLPLGGYIRMIGMLPPRPTDAPGTVRSVSTGPWQGLIENARDVALEEVRPGDEDRVFYRKPWWQKVIIMSGGPAMNFVLAFILFGVVLMGFGIPTQKTEIASIPQCVKTAADYVKNPECTAADRPSPASAAGLRPGDVIVSVAGRPATSWDARDAGHPRPRRGPDRDRHQAGRSGADRQRRPHRPGPRVAGRARQDRKGCRLPRGEPAKIVIEQQSLGAVAAHMGDLTSATAASLLRFPEKMVGVWHAAFSGDERDQERPDRCHRREPHRR